MVQQAVHAACVQQIHVRGSSSCPEGGLANVQNRRVTSRDRLFQVSVGILAFSFVLIITLLYTQCQPFSENYDIDGNSCA